MTDYKALAKELRDLGGAGFMRPDGTSQVRYGVLYRTASAIDERAALDEMRLRVIKHLEEENAALKAESDGLREAATQATWAAEGAIIHRKEEENRARNLREERDNLLSVLNERDEAPLWRRVAQQRLELARLNRAAFRHSADVHQLRGWFRAQIAADGGQARKKLWEAQAAIERVRGYIHDPTKTELYPEQIEALLKEESSGND
jgi:hypothetical protein